MLCCLSVPRCTTGSWTRFFDGDNPTGTGDYETTEILLRNHPGEMCRNPTSFDARVVSTNASFDTVGQVLQVNLTHGISCINSDNTGDCLDYKIRFCCPTRERCAFESSFNVQLLQLHMIIESLVIQ